MSLFVAVLFWFAHILSALCLLTLDCAIKPFEKAWKEHVFAVTSGQEAANCRKVKVFLKQG